MDCLRILFLEADIRLGFRSCFYKDTYKVGSADVADNMTVNYSGT
jgi:hypothetical protein